ncbi:MAG: AAA family ATPase [Treponematales bacterium]
MNGYRINLSSSTFERFIKDGLLYVDKTLFIEHFLEESSSVLLIARPRRMGKSLNMNMLDAYLDLKRDSAPLFAGLKIENRPCFKEHINRYPVIYMDFRLLRAENYQKALRDLVMEHVDKYLPPEKWNREVAAFAGNPQDMDSRNLRFLTKNLYEVYGQPAVILIDEYDHVLMDNVGKPEYGAIRDYISAVFETSLKGNDHLYKALLTGVLRVSQESMFSKLNNIKVYDVFTPGAFDEDFGLTEDEVRFLVPVERFGEVKDWYNNVHVGDSWVFYIYSVLSFLADAKGEISNYWGQSGAIDLLGNLLTPDRALRIGKAVKELGTSFVSDVDSRVSLDNFFGNKMDEYYYAVAIQAGYLTFENALPEKTLPRKYRIRVPNKELLHVWRSYILSKIVRDPENRLGRIFAGIDNLEKFSRALSEFVSFKLSYFDLEADALEKTFHVFIFGMILTLDYECASNMEGGYGRYDLLVKAPGWTAAMEFKVADKEDGLGVGAQEALKQIYDQKYLAGAQKNKPAYAIGVGCYKKRCVVIAESAAHPVV